MTPAGGMARVQVPLASSDANSELAASAQLSASGEARAASRLCGMEAVVRAALAVSLGTRVRRYTLG